jgi:integrase
VLLPNTQWCQNGARKVGIVKFNLSTSPRRQGNSKYWYYWYIDEAGFRVRKSTGATKKVDAQAFVDELNKQAQKEKEHPKGVLFSEYTRGFFDLQGRMMKRWRDHGKIIKLKTIISHQFYLNEKLIPWFGDTPIMDITAKALDVHLLRESRSGSWKNCIKDTLTLIMKEAQYDGHIDRVPAFRSYARNSKRQDILSDEELKQLFPFDPIKLRTIWTVPSDEYTGPHTGFMFAIMSALAVSGGLRSGEVRAIHREQLIDGKGLIIDRAFDDHEGKLGYLKKGSATDPRYRVVPLPDYTLALLADWLKIRSDKEGPLFLYHGEMVNAKYLLKRFQAAMKKAGISQTGRRTTFHGLRYTYNTKMKLSMPRELLHEIVGHRSDDMTDHYDRPILEQRLEEYRGQVLPAVNGFWK